MAARGFSVVDNDPFQGDIPQPVAADPAVQNPRLHKVAVDMLQLALVALSQRFVVAVASLFTLLTVGSVFVLWYLTPDPSQTQIVSLALYAVFILAVNYLNMRRGR